MRVPADAPPPKAPASSIPIDYRQLPWTGRFIRDYCHDFDQLEPFFAGSPTRLSSWVDALDARRQQRPNPAIVDILARQLAGRDAPAPARAAVERLREDRTVAVVTGQQAGLFGGPLFTLLKALTTIKLARQVAVDHDVTVVPIFWVDAEDHDLDEIRACHVLDAELSRTAVTLDLGAPPGTSAATVQLDASVTTALAQLRNALPATEFTDDVVGRLETAYAEGVRLVDAFARWLDALLGGHGLVVFDASDRAAKPLVQSVFARELGAPGTTTRLATGAGAELVARGYHSQVSPTSDSVALFRLDGTRQPIRTSETGFTVGDRTFAAEALLGAVEAEPARFSPSVLLRPIVQDALFPTVAYIAGPNELAYLGQLREVYQAFGVPMPVIFPRASATIVDAATIKFLSRYRVEFARLQPQDDGVLNQLLEAQLPAEVERAVAETDRVTAERLEALAAAVPAIDPTLVGAVQSTRGRMERDLRNLRGKIIQAAKRRDEALRRQFHRARAQSFPDGAPQERSVGGVYFLNRYGFAFIDRVLDELPLEPGHHWLLTV